MADNEVRNAALWGGAVGSGCAVGQPQDGSRDRSKADVDGSGR